ncbi:2-phospho-L-lactate guanylyltransferase [Thermomicrobium sp. 4228-Ro]|uniref:2-phospho-L-lactate guanylyltransferase n=1 Tax=Thermomicrobium sp. 4228-Ro TaxID=2993937 RepID=UPI002249281D|nr:2-phospho-L-lactate guanylyltransferase [Thermomicrobium sp. 4228-Ro]MCX2727825.1 2-phospho-L-lactate guanylyltransferase [Thermomicrobium sp. 4228-Ro]
MIRTLAVIPVQRLDTAKSRLAPVLDPASRRSLVLQLAERTVRLLRSVSGIDEVALVTPDPHLAVAARAWGALPLEQTEPGLERAIVLAQRYAVAEDFGALLVVLGDLPLLEMTTLRTALALLEPHGVVLAPDRHGTGTNLLALSPPDLPIPAFGPESRVRHRLAARRARCTLREVWALPLALDLDTPEDLARLRSVREREGET